MPIRNALLSDAIEEYRAHCQARGLAERSVKNMCQPVRKGLALWGNIQVRSVTGQHIDRLFRTEQWSPSTRNLYVGCLRAFFTWARREGYIPRDFDPTDGWRNVRVPRVEKMRLPLEEFPALLDAAHHPRDRALCAIGLFAMLRGSEVQTLKVRDLDLDRFTLSIYRHKTQESDVLPVSAELATELTRWLNWLRQDQGRLSQDWYLIPAKMPQPTLYDPETRQIGVDSDAIVSVRPGNKITHPYRAVQRALSVMGYDTEREGEHTLRRSGARALFDQLRSEGYDGALMRVSSMLGHRDTRITEKYIGLTLERTQRNEMIAGKTLYPSLAQTGSVIQMREVV